MLARVALPYPSDTDVLIVMAEGGLLVGAVHADDEGTLRHIYVVPASRGTGAAHALLNAVRNICGRVQHDNLLSEQGKALIARERIRVVRALSGEPSCAIDQNTAETTGTNLLTWAGELWTAQR